MRKSDKILWSVVAFCFFLAYISINKIDIKSYLPSLGADTPVPIEHFTPYQFSSDTHQTDALPRTIIALYDSKQFPKVQYTLIHNFAEMPLNHLGLIVEYHDIRQGLPNLDNRKDVRGILTWFRNEAPMDDPKAYLGWAAGQIEQGRKYVVMGLPGFRSAKQRGKVSVPRINDFYKLLGLEYVRGKHVMPNKAAKETVLFKAEKPEAIDFEHALDDVNIDYHTMHAKQPSLTPYIESRQEDESTKSAILASTHNNGGVVESGFAINAHYSSMLHRGRRAWLINPFLFFADAFDTKNLPKPDTTTLMGKRIFYSHIDGDGWNGLTGNCDKYQSCAQALHVEIIKAYPDVPMTIAPIAGDLDANYGGSVKARNIAKNIFSLPHVEAASHTYTHPMKWSAFKQGANYVNPRDVKAYKEQGYDQMRLYSKHPFRTTQEVSEAAKYIGELTPEHKPLQLIQWSGDTSPSMEAVQEATTLGVLNINGGDTRFDSHFDSYAWVRPIGLRHGNYVQIYASNSNENTYTNEWKGPFFSGLRKLKETWDNTESPIRIKPMNLYYHVFSAERKGGVGAIKHLLAYKDTQRVIPIQTSRYAYIANGFFSTEIIPAGKKRWKIRNRKGLQTIRFDNKPKAHVNMGKSQGVLGYHHYQNNLYVHLDPAAEEPIIKLTSKPKKQMHLTQSSWYISNKKKQETGWLFNVRGFGDGKMIWHMAEPGNYQIALTDLDNDEVWSGTVASEPDGVLSLAIQANAINPMQLTISHIDR